MDVQEGSQWLSGVLGHHRWTVSNDSQLLQCGNVRIGSFFHIKAKAVATGVPVLIR
jgi:hypothetical protein